MPTISAAELKTLREQGTVELFDVRTPLEFSEVHVVGATNVPLDQLNPATLLGADRDPTRPLYVVCRSGTRGQKACEKLSAAGFTNVINIDGGTQACEQAGVPVVRGKKVMSLERQVRIAAGGLALTGAVLALTVHPWFAGIPAFIGAGLVFAGISDWCGMGLLLAKMPWNRGASCHRLL
jgi:rhodanese-related sulfurtransferase